MLLAVAAIRFLYRVTLKRGWCIDDAVPTCRRPMAVQSSVFNDGKTAHAFEAGKTLADLPVFYDTLAETWNSADSA